MATRTIVTSQPDVACDVCARRLLRGEQPDVFIGAGRRRIVCELCAPRAAHEGWMRETDSQSLTLPPMRARRGRSLFDRLRQVGRPAGGPALGSAASASQDPEAAPYDLFAESAPTPTDPAPARPARSHLEVPTQELAAAELLDPAQQTPAHADVYAHAAEVPVEHGSETYASPAEPSAYLREAVAVFNASEFPRRVAGVSRSLGPSMVTVRSAEHLSSVVTIVVAWELCWYRYEVDLSEPVVEATLITQGTELAELAREDRLANAVAGESGALALSVV
ncbi:MAG TPA: hypothetical protein VK778_13755 [Solirubrobacteraceae bacterium]|jgi:hypothetical protein|nr:hypothetical protein [Solirubrobacteraceae bacterium]